MDKWDVIVLIGLIIVVLGYVVIVQAGAPNSSAAGLTVLGGFSVLFGTATMAYGTWMSFVKRRRLKAQRNAGPNHA